MITNHSASPLYRLIPYSTLARLRAHPAFCVCMLETRVFTDGEIRPDVLAQIRRLVFDAYAGDFSEEDWEHTRDGWRVVVFDGGAPVSHAAVVARVLQVAQRTLQTGYVEGVAPIAE